MRVAWTLIFLLWPFAVSAQTKAVLPNELSLAVTVEQTDHTPFVREMVLITIRGIYRRHITREMLTQPDLDGFSWTQLGPDTWRDERLNGEKVKTLTRRMAIYPDRAGDLTIGAFTHNLTLTDERDDWFEHPIYSEPVTITVAPAPAIEGWWFPVKSLKISDQWSNAPDQLEPGEGVLRVIRIEALGVTPEMIPPMPDLNSPSGMIFPHPDKRLAELSPAGPISYSFWRWTVRPGNDNSAIVEPISFQYFDTVTRQMQTVSISAQRVAYGKAVPQGRQQTAPVLEPARLPDWPAAALAVLVFVTGFAIAHSGWRLVGASALSRFKLFDPLRRRLRQAARKGELIEVRRHAAALMTRDGGHAVRAQLLSDLDASICDPNAAPPVLAEFVRRFLAIPTEHAR
ncbi:hypothetical protein [uncultured Roseobacter sp.]|uniref:hypothetical protein n=1 Tax=uncultured Roseobacter sp. TaxID=114847 RepID=UPI0026031518|nr:hypothetical protein [uncultured Roseobacter sp.]